MKKAWVFWMLCVGVVPGSGLEILPGHVDLRWTWEVSDEEWRLDAVGAGAGTFDPSEVFLPLSDKPWNGTSNSGARIIQPNNATQHFTGVPVGQPSWYAVISLPGTGEAWPGFESLQGNTVFGEYFETDTRLPQPQSSARPWIKVSMGEVFHDGPGEPEFSMWTGTGSAPRIWMSTSNGQQDNFFLYSGGSHTHMNWTFGAQGIYRIGLSASAFLGPGKTNPTGESDDVKVTFAIGPVARWQATYFNGEELENPVISGMSADPDGDARVNLLEYAFGLHPRVGDAAPVAEGLGMPEISMSEEDGKLFQVLRYPRRKAGALLDPLIYIPQFSETLREDDWQPVVGEIVDDLDTEWEIVEAKREVPEGAVRGFGRVKVGFGEE
jgi:surface-anchored protein